MVARSITGLFAEIAVEIMLGHQFLEERGWNRNLTLFICFWAPAVLRFMAYLYCGRPQVDILPTAVHGLVTLHSNHGFWFGRSGYCTQTADFEVCLYSNRGQSSGGRRPHGIGSQVAVRGVEARHHRSGEGTIGGFAFKPRTNFLGNFVRDLTTNVRDLSAA